MPRRSDEAGATVTHDWIVGVVEGGLATLLLVMAIDRVTLAVLKRKGKQ